MQNELNVHDTLINIIKKYPYNDYALLLSGGIDSASLLFALLELKKNVTCYSFTLNGKQSTDFLQAKGLCKRLGVKFVPIYLPTDVESLKNDCVRMATKYGCRKKTDFECLWAFLYVYENVKERAVMTGIPADGHFCISKKGMIHYRDKIDTFRKMYFSNPTAGQRTPRMKLAKEFGKVNVDPYFEKEMYSYFLGTTWEQCNKPNQKQPILNAFPEQFKKMKIRKHTNLQLGDSGISAHFKVLLKTEYNTKNYKSVVGVFNEIVRRECKK